jgi:hypothetical protein
MDRSIEVNCPHCGARGQVMIPLMGAIVIGPCPHCSEFVCIFCGRALPIRKDVILSGTDEEKRSHLLDVLTHVVEERVGELMEQMTEDDLARLREELPAGDVPAEDGDMMGCEASDAETITQSEVEHFLESELPHIDNYSYFRAIFD